MSYVQGTKDVNGVLGIRVNHGNPNRMTGTGKGVVTGMPTKMTAKEVLSVRSISTTQRMSGKGKVGPVNPARPDRLRADTYSRTCNGACRK